MEDGVFTEYKWEEKKAKPKKRFRRAICLAAYINNIIRHEICDMIIGQKMFCPHNDTSLDLEHNTCTISYASGVLCLVSMVETSDLHLSKNPLYDDDEYQKESNHFLSASMRGD
ncbi:uncharacterized protein G2W53_000534 [Senna tora]|uniref:Uncharacterized protein n=1 Tax=Senna tora TaxID=362788 RepID=A0A835CIK2_9FABA|nr:uncharacterized protein G2W53_000534 [Senna tora]